MVGGAEPPPRIQQQSVLLRLHTNSVGRAVAADWKQVPFPPLVAGATRERVVVPGEREPPVSAADRDLFRRLVAHQRWRAFPARNCRLRAIVLDIELASPFAVLLAPRALGESLRSADECLLVLGRLPELALL